MFDRLQDSVLISKETIHPYMSYEFKKIITLTKTYLSIQVRYEFINNYLFKLYISLDKGEVYLHINITLLGVTLTFRTYEVPQYLFKHLFNNPDTLNSKGFITLIKIYSQRLYEEHLDDIQQCR